MVMSVSATRWLTVARWLCLGRDMTSDCAGSATAPAAKMIPREAPIRSMYVKPLSLRDGLRLFS